MDLADDIIHWTMSSEIQTSEYRRTKLENLLILSIVNSITVQQPERSSGEVCETFKGITQVIPDRNLDFIKIISLKSFEIIRVTLWHPVERFPFEWITCAALFRARGSANGRAMLSLWVKLVESGIVCQQT